MGEQGMSLPGPIVPVLALRNISKTFGGEHALRGVDLTVLPGQVHGLLGENGSGKSTLIKILAGFHAPEPGGEMEFNGQPVKLPLQAGQFRSLGMSFVHQDLALVPSLTVVENLRIGEVAARKRWHVSWSGERRRAREVFQRYGVNIDPAADVADLSVVDRALLAIIRAVEEMRTNREVRGDRPEESDPTEWLLVLDEATATLPSEGVDKLFALIRRIAAAGSSILFVSHDLDEVLEITDRITVLRDGKVAGTVITSETDETRLVEMIIGRTLHKLTAGAHGSGDQQAHVSIRELTGGALKDISLDLTSREIVGLTGLVGSGFEDFPYLVFGARPAQEGQLVLSGQLHDLRTMQPHRAISLGIALLPADRLQDGSIPTLSVADNISMQVMDDYSTLTKLNRLRLRQASRSLMRTFDVRPLEPRATFESLSGGNQQKVVLAKWIRTGPKLLLLHEPTVGVDVGARQQIFKLIRDAANSGTAVICCSSDYEQLADLCDRVLIISGGRIVRQLQGTELTKERIAEQCLTSGFGEEVTSTFMEAGLAGGTAAD
jgi:ribose transport system ATP-binding protein